MKNITTSEKVVFTILLVFVSSVARAAGMKMAFSNTLIILAVLFFIYKLIIRKLNRRTKIYKRGTVLVLLGLLLLAGWFYWYEVRPVKIRSYCNRQAIEKATSKKEDREPSLLDRYLNIEPEDIVYPEDYKFSYSSCLNEKGLK